MKTHSQRFMKGINTQLEKRIKDKRVEIVDFSKQELTEEEEIRLEGLRQQAYLNNIKQG